MTRIVLQRIATRFVGLKGRDEKDQHLARSVCRDPATERRLPRPKEEEDMEVDARQYPRVKRSSVELARASVGRCEHRRNIYAGRLYVDEISPEGFSTDLEIPWIGGLRDKLCTGGGCQQSSVVRHG